VLFQILIKLDYIDIINIYKTNVKFSLYCNNVDFLKYYIMIKYNGYLLDRDIEYLKGFLKNSGKIPIESDWNNKYLLYYSDYLYLYLEKNNIISDISMLTNLTNLDLGRNNKISDISIITKLTNLNLQ